MHYATLIHRLFSRVSPFPAASSEQKHNHQLQMFVWSRVPSVGETQNCCGLPTSPWCLLGGGKMCLWVRVSFPSPWGKSSTNPSSWGRALPSGLLTEREGARETFTAVCCGWWLISGGLWAASWSDWVRLMQMHFLWGDQRGLGHRSRDTAGLCAFGPPPRT